MYVCIDKSNYALLYSASLSVCLHFCVPKGNRQGDSHAKLSVLPSFTAVELPYMHGGSQAARVMLEIHTYLYLPHRNI